MRNGILLFGLCMLIVLGGCANFVEEHKSTTNLEYLASLSCEDITTIMIGCCAPAKYIGCHGCEEYKEIFRENKCEI